MEGQKQHIYKGGYRLHVCCIFMKDDMISSGFHQRFILKKAETLQYTI